MKTIFKSILTLPLCILTHTVTLQDAKACDYCSIYTPMNAESIEGGDVNFGIAEDLFGYTKYRREGETDITGEGQNRKSNITDLTLSVGLLRSFALEVSVPFIDHNYRRLEATGYRGDSESGVGDVTLYALFNPIQTTNFVWQFYGGAKLPTGDTARLKEEDATFIENNLVPGHDLALGSGSVDVPLGSAMSIRTGSLLLEGNIEYILRSEGDYGYQYADDLRWRTSLGLYFDSSKNLSVIPRFNLSGLSKDADMKDGADVVNTGLDIIEVGPSIDIETAHLTFGLGIDVPVSMDNNGFQAMQDHRVRFQVAGKL